MKTSGQTRLMPFTKIRFYNFRNLVDAEIPVPNTQVFFIGENGQGKTNFLEAIYTLCYGRSFRTASDGTLMKHDATEMSLFGTYESEGTDTTSFVSFKGQKKDIQLDGKPIHDRKELVDRFPCVIFCHEDLEFVRGGPEFQRQFFDQTASLLYPRYLADLRDYGKTLKTRNVLLKEERLDLIQVYDVQLCRLGMNLHEQRKKVVGEFNGVFGTLFQAVSGGISDVAIRYKCSWEGLDADAVCNKLRERQKVDLALRTTSSGPHRDKYFFNIGDRDFRDSASTGQFRLLSLLLRLAQASLIRKLTGKKPVLLLDDVLLELDFEKRKRFLSMLPEHEQAFFTFLPDEQVGSYVQEGALCYQVRQGSFYETSR